jgi:hypothetical protein
VVKWLTFNGKPKPNETARDMKYFETVFKKRWKLSRNHRANTAVWKICIWKSRLTEVRGDSVIILHASLSPPLGLHSLIPIVLSVVCRTCVLPYPAAVAQ